MDDPNMTMEEYIKLEEEKARRRDKVYNWESATYGKIWYDKGVHGLRSPTVSSLNNDEIDFRISFDESDVEDFTVIYDKNSFSYKIISINDLKTDSENDNDKVNTPSFPSPEPTVSYFDDLDFFKDFENEFSAIVYNDAQTSKSDLLTGLILNPQHIDEFNLKDETSLSECDNEEQNVLNLNDLFPFNVVYPDDLKSDKDNDDDKIDIEHSLGDLSVKPLPDAINTDVGAYAHGSNKSDLDNSTSNVLIPLDSWTSGLLVYKLSLSVRLFKDDQSKPYYGRIRQAPGRKSSSMEAEFPAIVVNDDFAPQDTLQCRVDDDFNDEIDFRISFDESYDEDYTIICDKNSFSYKMISINNLKTDSENDYEKVMPLNSIQWHAIHMGGPLFTKLSMSTDLLRYEGLAYTASDISQILSRVFTSQAWRRMFSTRGLLVWELILEFLSTLRFGEVLLDLDAPDTIQFQLGGARRRLSWRGFILALGLHTMEEMESPDFASVFSQHINMAYPLPLDAAYRSSGTETEILVFLFDFRAKFFLPFFRANPTDIFTLVTGRTYQSYNNINIELNKEFLEELQKNTYHGWIDEDVVNHIAKVLEMVDLIHVPGVDSHQLRMKVFPLSLTNDAWQWWKNEGEGKITIWEELVEKFFCKFYPESYDGEDEILDEGDNWGIDPLEFISRVNSSFDKHMKIDGRTKKVLFYAWMNGN
ncbi:hypothetical protein Tco_0965541 [Tanacetum coccineum]